MEEDINIVFHNAASIINASRNPIILLGAEAIKNEQKNEIFQFISATDIPFTSTINLFEHIHDSDILTKKRYIGHVGDGASIETNSFLNACDCVIAIEYTEEEFSSERWNRGRSRPIIWISKKSPESIKHLNILSKHDSSVSKAFNFIKSNLKPRAYALSPFVSH
jgi:thiamine pyrophosphate-dependent acetolactate synthase large subunit-like protein